MGPGRQRARRAGRAASGDSWARQRNDHKTSKASTSFQQPLSALAASLKLLWPAAALGYLVQVAFAGRERWLLVGGGIAALALALFALERQGQSVDLGVAALIGLTWALFSGIDGKRRRAHSRPTSLQAAAYSPTECPRTAAGEIPHEAHRAARACSSASSR